MDVGYRKKSKSYAKHVADGQIAGGCKCPHCYKVWSSCRCEEVMIARKQEARCRQTERNRKNIIGAVQRPGDGLLND